MEMINIDLETPSRLHELCMLYNRDRITSVVGEFYSSTASNNEKPPTQT